MHTAQPGRELDDAKYNFRAENQIIVEK